MTPRSFLPRPESELLHPPPGLGAVTGHTQKLRLLMPGHLDTEVVKSQLLSPRPTPHQDLRILIPQVCQTAGRLAERRVPGLGDCSVVRDLALQAWDSSKLGATACACNPITPVVRWRVDTRDPRKLGPASFCTHQ